MPSDIKRGGRRTQIYSWRVKDGNKEIFSDVQKFKCEQFMRDNKKEFHNMRLIPPNK
jgi:hypothetical protein